MANRKIDLSGLKKDDIEIVSLTGHTYTIPGNFSSELFIELYKTYDELKALKNTDIERAFAMLKEWALAIISMDKSQQVSMETVEREFNDFKVLEMLLTNLLKMAND
ncbi:MAG: hypothetical protein E7425_07785 [Ruminococcaceae bacterium]|nr:hypothetical protein [Oscillospiraceae bacterium]